MNAAAIVTAEAWLCPLPLAHPLRLGPIHYLTRDYVVLRMTSADGISGLAVGYTRGTPLLESTELLCRQLLGSGRFDPRDVHRDLAGSWAHGWAALVRAASLIDIALWDTAARRQRIPLYQALGAEPREVPLMAVAGYFADQRSGDAVLDEIRRFVDEGYSTLKVMLGGVDARTDRRLLERIRAQTPDHVAIAVDLHGAFATADQAIEHCTGLEQLGVRFIEDPFPSFENRPLREFTRRSPCPVAAGEDVVGLSALEDLMDDGVAYLRLDATTSGGYTTALAAIDAAERVVALVAPHVWPHLHAPLAARSDAVTVLEVIPQYVGADPIWDLLTGEPPIRDGMWLQSERPGLDLPLEIDAVERVASRRWNLSSPDPRHG